MDHDIAEELDHNVSEHTHDAVDEVIHLVTEAPPSQELYDCVAEHGHSYGVEQGVEAFAAGTVGAHPESAGYEHAFNQAVTDCGIDNYSPPDAHIPSLSSPLAAAADIMFTPIETNPGETEFLHSQGDFQNAYQGGYHDSVSSLFDSQLESQHSGLEGVYSNSHSQQQGGWDDPSTANLFQAATGFEPSASSDAMVDSHPSRAEATPQSTVSRDVDSPSHGDASPGSGGSNQDHG